VTGVAAGTAVISYGSDGATVTVNATPNAGTISGTAGFPQVCIANTITLSSNGASGGTWSAANTIVSVDPSTGVVTGNAKGTDIVSYTVSNGTCASSATVTLTSTGLIGNIYTYGGNGTLATPPNSVTAFDHALKGPRAMAADNSGTVYFVDAVDETVVKITTAGIVSVVAGAPQTATTNAATLNDGDGGQATAAHLNMFGGGGLYVNNAGDIYISCSGSNANCIRKVDHSTGIITTIAGLPGVAGGYNGDNIAATSAKLNSPFGITFDTSGNLYITDQLNFRIRKVNTSGIITTIAGTGANSFGGDNSLATAAYISQPRDVKFDILGNLYFTDATNNRIRMINPSGIIRTICGTGTANNYGDGGLATAANLNLPARLAYDGAAILYVSDQADNVVRAINLVTG
jgi:hypothetical protein